MKRAALALLLLATLAAPRHARAEGSVGSFELWFHQGIATQSLKDWNDQLDLINQGLQFFGLPDRMENLGNAIPFGMELNYRVKERIRVGIGFQRQRALVNNGFTDPIGFAIQDVPSTFVINDEMTLNMATAIVGLDIGRTGLTVWGELGYGFAEAEEFTQITPLATPGTPIVSGTARWDGSGMVGAMALGFNRELGGRSVIRARVGYQLADMGELEGPAGPPMNFQGEVIGTDFSGIHITGSIGLILNRVR